MGHSAGTYIDKFCTQRADSCTKHQQKYRDNCKVSWEYQAHHVLCVASVTEHLSANTKITPILLLTDWCINTEENMLAMPPYFSTMIKYYADWFGDDEDIAPPPFDKIPIHGFGHPAYKLEIDKQMKSIAKDAEETKEKHEAASGTLKAALDNYRNRMKTRLQKRGKRGANNKGTHFEWMKAYSGDPSDDWYMSFSMADDDDVEERDFPMTGGTKGGIAKAKRLVQLLL